MGNSDTQNKKNQIIVALIGAAAIIIAVLLEYIFNNPWPKPVSTLTLEMTPWHDDPTNPGGKIPYAGLDIPAIKTYEIPKKDTNSHVYYENMHGNQTISYIVRVHSDGQYQSMMRVDDSEIQQGEEFTSGRSSARVKINRSMYGLDVVKVDTNSAQRN